MIEGIQHPLNLVIATLILGISLPTLAQGSSNHVDKPEAPQGSHQDDNSTKEDQAVALTALREIATQIDTISRHLAPDAENEAIQNENERHSLSVGIADLSQQTRMADSTQQMAWFSGAALLVSTWGIYLLYRNLGEARKATSAAEAAAHAALEQTKQNRAWIIVSKGETLIDAIDGNPRLVCKVSCDAKGETPAKDAIIRLGGTVFNASATPSNLPEINFEIERMCGVIAPGRTLTGRLPLTLNNVCKIASSTLALYVRVQITYRTIYDEKERISEGILRLQCTIKDTGVVDSFNSAQSNVSIPCVSTTVAGRSNLT